MFMHDLVLTHLLSIGPMLFIDTDTDNETIIHRVTGVVSFGFECAKEFIPGYYAPVFPQNEWIKSIMKKTNTCPNVHDNKLERCSSSRIRSNSINLVLIFYCMYKNIVS